MHRHATQIFIKSLHLSPYLCTNQIQHLKLYHTRSYRPLSQYVISICMVLAVSLIAFAFSDLIGYKVVALILLMTVSVVAMLFEIFPVLLTAWRLPKRSDLEFLFHSAHFWFSYRTNRRY